MSPAALAAPAAAPDGQLGDWLGIVWLIVLLAGNAFFVASEFAVISARRSQIEPRAEAGSRAAQTALFAMEHATSMLAACQLGVTVCSLLILNVSEPAIHHLLEGPLAALGLSADLVAGVAFAITLVLVSYLHVVLGEMVPKNISFSVPDRAVLLLAPPLVFFAKVFAPIVRALNGLANLAVRALGVTPRQETASAFTFDEVAGIVEQSKREGVLEDPSGTLSNAFEFTGKRVAEVAIPLAAIVALRPDASPAEVQRAVGQVGFSRYLVSDGDGGFSGYVHLKDVLDLDSPRDFHAPIPAKRIRALMTLLEETELEDALATMRRTGNHVAQVRDRAGNLVGVLFLEDIIEELVGEVRDATRR